MFAGLKSAVVNATVAGQVDLSWNTALDNVTAATAIDYLIYVASTPGGENFAAPSFITSPGSTSFPLTNLSPGTHYAVVRSRDAAGNIDTNTVERSATIVTSGISVINSCNPVETVFSFTFSTVAVHSTATIANTGSETVNGISCSDNKTTNLAGVPTSLAPGASATITGSYSPPAGASNGPYNDTVTCSGTGTQSGLAVTATGPTSCNFAPSISLANVGCARDANFAQIAGDITNTGNETVTLVSCTDTMGSSVPAPTLGVLNPSVSFHFSTGAVTTLATSDTLTCTGVGAFSKTLVSRTATTPCN